MCGIAGIVSKQQPTQPLLQAMIEQLHHRGPDGYGFHIDQSVGLAHARLSIIDLEGGSQPIHNEDQSVWVVFNGEIFNYLELRDELQQKGHRFYTHSDTEVIVHLYEEFGDEFVQYLNGQFAIALWDKPRQRLVLTRDRVGIAPLFYSEQRGGLLFGSEVKAMLPAFEQAPELDQQALDQLLTFWAPVSPRTLFSGVFEVSPGQQLVYENGQISKRQYWQWLYPETEQAYWTAPEAELKQQLHDLLVSATQLRLRSDVPVGAYLSGGLDSSVLTSLIHHHSDAPLRTFSIGFADKGLDESSFQQTMIDHLGADHSRIQCSNEQVGEAFAKTIWHTESPVLRTAPTPMRLLSGLVNQHDYKVVLTGEGSDEVLGGYDIFKESKIRQFWARNPDSSWRPQLLQRLYPYLDVSSGPAQAYVQRFFGVGIDNPAQYLFSHLPRWQTTAKAKVFYAGDFAASLRADAYQTMEQSLPAQFGSWHGFNRGQFIEAKTLMGGYLLCSQGDRMLMANSVEGRFPFLDHRVIEFANRLPPKLKMKVLDEKYLLKRVAEPYLPKGIVQRHKQPYRAPDVPAFVQNGQAMDYVDALLSESNVAESGYFDSKKVAMLLRKAKAGKLTSVPDNQAFVGILSTQLWHQHFIQDFKNFKH